MLVQATLFSHSKRFALYREWWMSQSGIPTSWLTLNNKQRNASMLCSAELSLSLSSHFNLGRDLLCPCKIDLSLPQLHVLPINPAVLIWSETERGRRNMELEVNKPRRSAFGGFHIPPIVVTQKGWRGRNDCDCAYDSLKSASIQTSMR